MIPLITNHALGIILWGTAIGCSAVWMGCELMAAREEDVLPPPQPDERDRQAEWRRIVEHEET